MIFACAFLASCATTGISSKTSASWACGTRVNGTLKLGRIQVDKGAAYAVEREIAVLLPLLCMENSYVFPEDSGEAEYVVDIHASERTYESGWQTKKSLSMEVYISKNKNSDTAAGIGGAAGGGAALVTPDVAARVLADGRLGFSSSKNLEHLLRMCVQQALARLPSGGGQAE
jgi:hypothetical protein